MAFGFYVNSSLTTPVTGNYQVTSGTHDYQFYFGNPTSGTRLQDATSPGVSQIQITIEDTNPGTGAEASWMKLSLTQAGLDTAVAGDPLDIGTSVIAGSASAIPFWVRVYNTLSGVSSSTDLYLSITNSKEFPV
jgi:hypothetical protein